VLLFLLKLLIWGCARSSSLLILGLSKGLVTDPPPLPGGGVPGWEDEAGDLGVAEDMGRGFGVRKRRAWAASLLMSVSKSTAYIKT